MFFGGAVVSSLGLWIWKHLLFLKSFDTISANDSIMALPAGCLQSLRVSGATIKGKVLSF